MSPSDLLVTLSEQCGFTVANESNVIRAVGVPCLLAGGVAATCIIEKSRNPASGKPGTQEAGAYHAVKIITDRECDGRVYNANGTSFENHLSGDDRTWSIISIHRGSQSNPEADASVEALLCRYINQIVGARMASGQVGALSSTLNYYPFKIPNTFESRIGLDLIQNRIKHQRIAIVGLGGTGSFLLDLIVKTPVKEIHILDSDIVEWHTLKKAPSAPTEDEIELIREGNLRKAEYHCSRYFALREGIFPHHIMVDDPSKFAEFLSEHPIDFAFVCIDQLTEGDRPRQDVVYQTLSQANIPFVDSGISLTMENGSIVGSALTSYHEAGSSDWEYIIPNGRIEGNALGYRNIQLPEINALAASLAVQEWRRRTGQYVSEESPPPSYKFHIGKLDIVPGYL